MEHSYSKDIHPEVNVEVMSTRSILIPRPPQCPSCHQHSTSDDILAKLENQQNDSYFDQLPPALNDSIAKMAMEETERLTKNVKNANSDDDDWDEKVNKFGWTKQQMTLYCQVTNCLDYDQLARLAVSGRSNEGIIRRCSIDKSVARMRMALASVHWNTQIIQWLHTVMSDHLPPTYMASYLDILQTLRTKVPTLVDKMLAIRPVSFNADFMQAVMKRPWVGNVPTKSRKLPGQSPIIVIVPATLNAYGMNQQPSSRMKRWFSLLGTMASIAPIQNTVRSTQSLENITEQLIGITRSKIQDLRNEMPNRHIILVGINTGASVALQVALVENVSSVISLGFSFNTLKGVRGQPDDRILELTTPVLFVLGENSARSSQEEIESLRERMSAQTMLLKVGSADHALRIPKFNRHLEGVTQSMVDNMIADEIQDFAATCILNPPSPREVSNYLSKRSTGTVSLNKQDSAKKRKHKDSGSKVDKGPPRKVGRPRLNRSNEVPTGDLRPEKPKPPQALLKQSNEAVKLTVQSTVQTVDLLSLPIDSSNTVSTLEAVRSMEPIAINLNTIENIPQIENNPANAQIKIVSPTTTISTTNIASPIPNLDSNIVQTNSQFIQVKPPSTQGCRIQSPNVKNFFIRKGIEKQATPTQTIMTSPGSLTPVISPNQQLSVNKKIIIKSQQILVPASNIKQTSPQMVPVTIVGSSDSVVTSSSSDLSGILDMPIMFADNEPSSEQQNDQIHTNTTPVLLSSSSSSSSSNAQIVSVVSDETQTTYPTYPNRPVVISAARIGKSVNITPAHNNKVILINRGQIKQQIVTTQSITPTSMVKTMPTIKLVPTSLSSNQVTFSNGLAKLAPGTKIDLSQLKIVKNVSPNAQGGITKHVFINNKPTTVNIGTQPGTKNAILIKTTAAQPTANPGIQANIMNRSITVRKVINAPSTTVTTAQPSVSVSPTPATTTVITSPSTNSPATQSSPRILRKSKISN